MGVIYAKGRGVEIDEDKAIQFYEKAALGGLDRAQYVYATWLRDGKATEKNLALAMDFFKRSSLQNYGPGLLELSLIHISEPTSLGMISDAVFC